MTIYNRLGLAAAVGVIASVALLASPAQAQDGLLPAAPWMALDTSGPGFTQATSVNSHIVDPFTVHLQADADDPDSKGTSVETVDLDIPVQAQQQISFRYELLDGGQCVAGAPRVFVEVDGTFVNSWDQLQPAGEQCGTDGVVTFVATQNGRIGAAGVVYDSGAGGAVRVSDLTINGQLVLFAELPDLCDVAGLEDLLADDEDCQEPTPTPSTTPATPSTDPSPAPGVDVSADEELPVTGSRLLPVLGIGGASLIVAGSALLLVRRRRRLTFTASG